MKANELRIGNFVATEGIDFVEVSKIDADFGICYKIPQEFGQFYPYKEVEPIPLTEEWLKKFGFIESGWKDGKPICFFFGIDEKFYFDWDEGVFDCGVGTYVESDLKMPHIKYVHQLQNLYFAITGEELTIKE